MESTAHNNPIPTYYFDNADMKQIFKVCDKTLQRWRKKEVVPYLKFGGKYYYAKPLIEAIAKERMTYLKFRAWNWDNKLNN
jgi:hypothetical protein